MESLPAQEVLVRSAVTGEICLRMAGQQTLKTVASAISSVLNVKDYRINLFKDSSCAYIYSISDVLQVSANAVQRNFPRCSLRAGGEMDTRSDLTGEEFDECLSPKLHLGRRLGRTENGEDIMLNADFDFTSWISTSFYFSYDCAGRDHQKLACKGMEGYYTTLPVLAI